jgi:hypothetical protein
MFTSVPHIDEGLNIETLPTLKVKPLIRLVGTWTPTVTTTEQQLILSFEIVNNKEGIEMLGSRIKCSEDSTFQN